MAKNTDRSGAVEAIRQYRPPDGFLSGDRILRTMHSVPLRVRVTGSLGTTTFADSALAGRGDDAGDGTNDAFIGWTVRYACNPIAASNLTVGETSVVTNYTDAGVFTFGALSGATVRGDEFDLIPPWLAQDLWTYASASISLLTGVGTETVATHEVLTVTGACEVKTLILCSETLTDAANAAIISFGYEGDTDAIIPQTGAAGNGGVTITNGDIWHDTSPAPNAGAAADVILDYVLNGLDVGYEITGAAITDGTLDFYFWWKPLTPGSFCVVAAGTGTL